jgi:hypothetical protein
MARQCKKNKVSGKYRKQRSRHGITFHYQVILVVDGFHNNRHHKNIHTGLYVPESLAHFLTKPNPNLFQVPTIQTLRMRECLCISITENEFKHLQS